MYLNKKLKLGFFFIAIVVLMASISSCKNYLSPANNSIVSTKNTFSSVSNTKAAITGIYGALQGDDGFGERLSLYYPLSSDAFKAAGDYDCNDRRGIAKYGPCPSNVNLNDPWKQLYRGINRANLAIKNIPKSPIFKHGKPSKQAKMKEYYGDALTLRAYFYFTLIKNWGDVPAPFKPSADIKNLYLHKTNRDSIYDKILANLKTAEKYIPTRSKSGYAPTKLTKGAVRGLRARIALFSGGYSLRAGSDKMKRRSNYKKYYQIAYNETKKVMESGEYSLNPSYENVFRSLQGANLDPTHSLMFVVGAYGGHDNADSKIGYYNGLCGQNGSKWPSGCEVRALPTYFYDFSKYDVRRDVSIAVFHINKKNNKMLSDARSLTDGKFRKPWTGVTGPKEYNETEWPILRYASILMMFAEADNELNHGPDQQAINAFNKVRRRAFKGHEDKLSPVPTTYQGFFKAIVRQRKLEFGGEGLRKYNLIRWNLLGDKIAQTKKKLKEFYNGTGPYSNVPQYIYAKPSSFTPSNSAKEEMSSLKLYSGSNPKSDVYYLPAPQTNPPSDYQKVDWRNALFQGYISGKYAGYAHYFKKNHSELLPIYQEFVNRNYNLTQDYGY